MIRACFVCGNIYPLLANRADIPMIGGAEVQQYLIARGLVERGFEISFVGEDFGQGSDATVGGLRLLAYRFSKNKLLQAWTLWRALGRADADIYYVRSLPKHGAIIYLFTRLYRRKLVQALAIDSEVDPGALTGRVDRLMFMANTWWRARANAVLAQSQFQAKSLREKWAIAAQVIPSVVPIPDTPRERSHDFSVLWVGSIDPRKRVEQVVQIAAELPEVEFVIAGGPVRGREAYYEQAKAESARQPNVRWVGFVPYNVVNELFANASVLLFTSSQEGFPNVFLQAWAMGVPCVTTGIQLDGLIAERGLGLCVEPSQAAGALRRLQSEPAMLQDMGERARAYAAEVHRPEVVLVQYETLFTRLMKS